jgi:RHS repeat-associated protein
MITGKERDVETGLDYFEARYRSAAQGRFTSVDPVSGWPGDPQSWNMYAYARNNPLLYTDPDGQTYRICDTSGHCDDNYTDANFDRNLSGSARNGSIFDKDGNKIGSYQRTSFDDLSGFGNLFFNQVSARRQASNQLIGGSGTA